MAQFDRFPEIDKSIRDFLLDYDAISDLVGERIFYFRASMPKGKEPDKPLIYYRRAGGVYGSYRYYFTIRTKTAEQLISLRRAVVRRFMSPMNLSSGENIVEARLDGQLSDGGDEATGWFESNFYVMFEMLEAGYG